MSETVTSSSRTRTAGKTTFLVVFCIGFLILSGFAVFCCFGLFKVQHYRQMIADGKTATAEIYRAYTSSKEHPAGCMYKYVDENGVEYIGEWRYFKTKEEAEQYLGQKIEIYIDGKGTSFPVGTKHSIGYAVTWVIVSIVFVCADTVGIVIMSVKIHRARRNDLSYMQRSV